MFARTGGRFDRATTVDDSPVARVADGAVLIYLRVIATALVHAAARLGELAEPRARRSRIRADIGRIEDATDRVVLDLMAAGECGVIGGDRLADACRAACLLDYVADHMESAAQLAAIHSARRIPERTAELLDIVARCALLTAEALSTPEDAALHSYVREIEVLAEHSEYVSRPRSTGSAAGRATEDDLAEMHDELLATVAAFRAASRACVVALAR
ncbi:hypothetical protein [Nocardia beijingensis]